MSQDTDLDRARRVLFEPGALESESTFRATLARLGRRGLQWSGLLGIVGLLVLVPVNAFLLGRPTLWWYPAPVTLDAFVLWDKAVVLLLCGGAVWVGRAGWSLPNTRRAAAGLALLIAVVSLVHDAYRGVLRTEYLIVTYLLLVAAVPYRPWQALLVGGAMTGALGVVGHVGVPGTRAARPGLVDPAVLVHMAFVTVVLAGVAALLYAARYHQHRARRRAERLRDQVAQLEKAKSRFFADVSHEFRTPLTLLLGTLREALDGRFGDLPSPLRDRLAALEGQSRRMRRLVNQLLELAQLDEDRLTLAAERHDLASLVEEIARPFRDWAEREGLTFASEIPPDAPAVWADADRVESILANLLSNAIKYTPEDGTIRVRVGRQADHALVAVRDTGPGLPEAVRARVFARHESAVPAGSDADRLSAPSSDASWIGMGIGLAHTKALVERHGGRLEVESEAGFGTEVTVRLPLGRDHLADEDLSASSAPAAPDDQTVPRRPRAELRAPDADDAPTPDEDAPEILVVDDEAEMRDYLRALLGRTYRVATAANGADGLEQVRERRPALVVSDLVMPERDGAALCRAIREDPEVRHVPVILLTVRRDQEGRLMGLRAGADAYLAKPFDPAELETRVENLIEIRRLVEQRVEVPDFLAPTTETVSSETADFLERVHQVIDAHIDNSTFGVDWLADEMDLSPRHLRRRLNDVTRLSPSGLIRARRLQRAATLLREGADTVSAVAAAVGYRDASYFSRLFRESFGCSPTDYAEQPADAPKTPPPDV
jgi:signal transduction histidine kinase/DNA-binding response OmpR family regulator